MRCDLPARAGSAGAATGLVRRYLVHRLQAGRAAPPPFQVCYTRAFHVQHCTRRKPLICNGPEVRILTLPKEFKNPDLALPVWIFSPFHMPGLFARRSGYLGQFGDELR